MYIFAKTNNEEFDGIMVSVTEKQHWLDAGCMQDENKDAILQSLEAAIGRPAYEEMDNVFMLSEEEVDMLSNSPDWETDPGFQEFIESCDEE